MTLQSGTHVESQGRFFNVVNESTRIKQHTQLFLWLQGDLQSLLPHDLLLVAYGDIPARKLEYDVISAVAGRHGTGLAHEDIESLLCGLFDRWQKHGRNIYSLDTTSGVILNGACQCDLHRTLRNMRSIMVQGMRDERAGIDALYVLFRDAGHFDDATRRMFDILLPHIDCAVRRIADTTLPDTSATTVGVTPLPREPHFLSDRESEILHWVGNGKTNYEIGMILGISPFTVKNHLQRIFRKIDVSNRAQAVSRFEGMNLLKH